MSQLKWDQNQAEMRTGSVINDLQELSTGAFQLARQLTKKSERPIYLTLKRFWKERMCLC